MNSYQNFLACLTKIHLLNLAKEQAFQEWGEDIPPTVLFAKLGKQVAETFDEFSAEERLHIFNIIESGMDEENIDLQAYVATGLLEALYTEASRDVLLWERICVNLGERSKRYLNTWEQWHRAH